MQACSNCIITIFHYTVPENVGLSIEGRLALAVILTILLIGVTFGVLIVIAVIKVRRSKKKTETESEVISPAVIYEDPEDIKLDLHTQGNVAYKHMQHM